MKRALKHTRYFGAVATGLALGFAFPPYPLGFLAWFAFVPLLLRLSAGIGWRAVIAESLSAFAVTVLIVGYWTLFHPNPASRNASIMGLVEIAVVGSVPFWFYGFGAQRTSLPLRFGGLIGVSGVIEFAQLHTEIGVPWLAVGHSQATLFPVNQLVAFGGVPGLSLFVLLANALAATAILSRNSRARTIAWSALIVFAFGCSALGYLQFSSKRFVVREHDVLAVQPGVPPKSWSNVRDQGRIDDLISLTRITDRAAVELIVWPETAVRVIELADPAYVQLKSFVDSLGVPLLTGAVVRAREDSSEDARFYNSALLIEPFKGISARYDKRILVPFAERVPYRKEFPWLKSLAVASGGVDAYRLGMLSPRISYGDNTVGIMICFESVFGRAAMDAESNDVAFFVVLAQDGWWGDTAGYRQHLAFSSLRAIETGRSVAQVTVTGTTGLLLPDGSIRYETEWMQRAAQRMKIPEYAGETVYTLFGDMPALVLGLCLFCVGVCTHFILAVKNKTAL